MRSRWALVQAGVALGAEPRHPSVGTLARDAQFLGDVSDRSAVPDHARDEQTAAVQIQAGVSVGHEDLLVGEDVRHLH